MESELDKFKAAYTEWKAAMDIYNEELANIGDWDMATQGRIPEVVAELNEKNRRFMEASKPFVYPK